MPRLRVLQVFYKKIVPISLFLTVMFLIMWEQGKNVDGNKSFPWTVGVLLIYGFVVTVVGIVYIQRLTKPTRRAEIVVESGRTQASLDMENERIQEHLRHVTERKELLEKQLNDQTDRFKRYVMHPLFQGGLQPSELLEQLTNMGYTLADKKWYAVISLQMEPLEQTRFEEKDRELLYFAISNMLEELVPSSKRLTPFRIEQAIVLFVMSEAETKESLKSSLEVWTRTIQTAIYHYLAVRTHIGVSRLFESIPECPSAFTESMKALKYRIWSEEEQSVFHFEELHSNHSIPFPEPNALEPEWFEAVKSGDRERAELLLHQIIREMFRDSAHPHGLEMSMVRLLLSFLDHMRQWGLDGDSGLNVKTSLLQQVLELGNAEEAEQWFNQMLMEPCIHTIEGTMKTYKRNLLDQIVHIIREEYDTDLSLEAVAGRLHYNANYLSGVFNKEMNITFSEYLAKYRHEMARKWLIETELPVKDIAHKLQYKNSQNFIRSFRKGQGITPGEYRLKYGRKHEYNDKLMQVGHK